MTSRSKLALAAALLVGSAALVIGPALAADSSFGWTKTFDRGWGTKDTLHVFCDGPHRIYIMIPMAQDSSATISTMKDGCRDWPKPVPTPKPPAEAPLQKGKP